MMVETFLGVENGVYLVDWNFFFGGGGLRFFRGLKLFPVS